MKKADLVFNALLVPIDFMMLVLAGVFAYLLRFTEFAQTLRPIVFELPFNRHFVLVATIAAFFLVLFALAGLYKIRFPRRVFKEFPRVVIAISAGMALVIVFTFSVREIFVSRFIVISSWFLAFIFVALGRFSLKLLQQWLVGKYNYGIHKVALVGLDGVGKSIFEELNSKPFLGYRVVARTKDFNRDEILKIIKNKGVDEVIQCNPNLSRQHLLELLDLCEERKIDFKFIPNLLEAKTTNIDIQALAGVPIVELKRTALDGWGKILKRGFDVVGSLLAILIFSPLLIATALAVKLTSPGPMIYKNERVGDRETFDTYKFRSMKTESCVGKQFKNQKEALEYEAKLIKERNTRSGPIYKIKNDPRLTPIGKFIRRTSLDEFPQFFNVLFGQMSLVGPRPHQPREVAKYQKHHRKVLNIKPGITGLAQISGRSDLDFEDEVRLDTHYVENWSSGLDLAVLLKTPFAVLKRRKAN